MLQAAISWSIRFDQAQVLNDCIISKTSFERVWDPILVPGAPKQMSSYFLNDYETWVSFGTNPLYAILHESIYCRGAASLWSAHRVRADHDNKFDAIKAAKEGRSVLFTGESEAPLLACFNFLASLPREAMLFIACTVDILMIFPWMYDESESLRPFKEATNILAEKEDCPLITVVLPSK
ncbi:myrosinase-binding protein-like [Hibiscus syriacus]|uniref:Myrosinase-binding protein-like n=1 Tax=Hibiscus syriacus TaxID=106335 RepID=A0A6A3A610_HIBSY|nr:myrosinase-binding protein-like [Hibiscus syriacus]